MKKDSLIFVAGGNGMVGSAIIRILKQQGFTKVITRTKKSLIYVISKLLIHFLKHKDQNMFS